MPVYVAIYGLFRVEMFALNIAFKNYPLLCDT